MDNLALSAFQSRASIGLSFCVPCNSINFLVAMQEQFLDKCAAHRQELEFSVDDEAATFAQSVGFSCRKMNSAYWFFAPTPASRFF